MADKHQAQLGAVQETLFIPLAARARETARKRPALRDPKAAELRCRAPDRRTGLTSGSGKGDTALTNQAKDRG